MSYESGIRFAIEHGPTNDVPADFSSVVFRLRASRWSWSRPIASTSATRWRRRRNDLAVRERPDVSVTSAFPAATASDAPSTGCRGHDVAQTRFRVAVDPANRGVRLRRLADLAAGRQTARVLVNGAFAGVWRRMPEVNLFLRWAEPDSSCRPRSRASRARSTSRRARPAGRGRRPQLRRVDPAGMRRNTKLTSQKFQTERQERVSLTCPARIEAQETEVSRLAGGRD